MRRSPALFLLFSGLLLTSPSSSARADSPGAGGMAPLQAALAAGRADDLSVTWAIGLPGTPKERLVVGGPGGQVRLFRCPAGAPGPAINAPDPCQPVAGPATLTAGQRDRLLSGLRATGLSALRSAGPDRAGSADRDLLIVARGQRVGPFSLPRADWPAPPGGDSEGLAAFLDGLARDLVRDASVRRQVPVPASAAELADVIVKFRLAPRTLPGGLLLIERGVASITPEEGSRPRHPAPAPWQHPLSAEEQDRLALALHAAVLDRLDAEVPRREAPAIGDDDGRLATLHLLPRPGGRFDEFQPQGVQRFLQDLLRSPAAPLCQQLLSLLTPPLKPQPPPRSVKEVIGRDDLVLTWLDRKQAPATAATVRMADLPGEDREALRQAVIIAGPYLGGRPKDGERVLQVAVPLGAPGKDQGQGPIKEHVVGTYGSSLASWRSGPTARLAHLLEARLAEKDRSEAPGK